ncbi:M4 family metallopeptidase [Nocardioides acrostichi]|uniref:Neutral metalloproteinase n=1 Tax=Nocardioides acrostichi TaxID=2784339 RepID=A0A930Y631_9ACTN|nr:M4 family metallopeptidase [Nocardioides acrostichi]MBF4160522.1 M4 family metallopeptidase [Nocardioides acrostichi]
MLKSTGLATAAVLAAGSAMSIVGVATATATAQSPVATSETATTATRLGDEVVARLADRALAALDSHPRAARATAGQDFSVTHTARDASGVSHAHVDRTYRGLAVLGGDMVVHTDASGTLEGISQTLAKPLSLGTTPAVAATTARAKALAAVEDVRGLRAGGKPTLVVDAFDTPRLAWQVQTAGTRTDGTPSQLTVLVDARNGKVLRQSEHVQNVDGDGQTLYSGDVPLNLTQSGSSYQLKDASRGGTYTTDMNNKTDGYACQLLGMNCSNGTLVTGSSTTFGNGSNSNRATAAADAQYGTDVTWDYYQNVHGRAGIFGDGSGSFNRVHYGNGYVNAFWDGTKMTYGDGDGTNYGPLVSLDVAGHEMSHGVTEHTAGLDYSGESGGLNEATSDIFGTMVEFYANNASDPGDYLIGEQFDLKNHLGFRRMDDPASDGSSANCWSSGVGNLDVHYSSGVGNHFFYLLAEGSGAKTIGGVAHNSPTCNGSSVAGIGRDAADKIWFRALTTYMTSGTDYHGARTATLDAATDLYGAGSTEYNAVDAAWAAVNVS